MKTLLLILFICLDLLKLYGQEEYFRTKSSTINRTINTAIANADEFIQIAVQPTLFRKHMKLNRNLSRLENDTTFHIVSLNDSINFIPKKYEIAYSIIIDGDTLTDMSIPIDSFGHVNVDTTEFHYVWDDLKAYNKLFRGKYKFDYKELKQLIRKLGLKEYSISFMNSNSTLNGRNYKLIKVFKHYWYITEQLKDLNYVVYTIDPDTGKVTIENKKNDYCGMR